MKCVAILGDLFLKTNEISLEIKGCPSSEELLHNEQRRVLHSDNMLVTDQMKSKIPFDFIKSRSTKYLINSLLLFIPKIVTPQLV